MKFILTLFFTFAVQNTMAFTPAAFTPNVVDETLTLSTDEIQKINEQIQNLREKNNIQAAVYLTKTLGSDSIEDAAFRTFNSWKLGDAEKDNGLLYMFVLDDRTARIEVGSGIEGDITDLHSKRLLDNVILPHFKEGNYAAGILDGINTTALLVSGQPLPDGWDRVMSQSDDMNYTLGKYYYFGWLAILYVIFPFLVFLSYLAPTPVKRKKKKGFTQPYSAQKASKTLMSNFKLFPNVFIILFFTVNPGVFIFFLGALIPLNTYLATTFASFKESGVLYIVPGILFILPMLVKAIAVQIGRKNNNLNPDCYRSPLSHLIFILNLNHPGIPVGIAAIMLSIWGGIALMSLSVVAGLGIILFFSTIYFFILRSTAKLLYSRKAYLRQEAAKRWNKIMYRSYGTREIFGKSYTVVRSTSSSSSGSSSSSSGGFSSSSSGGSSSGGGASSRW